MTAGAERLAVAEPTDDPDSAGGALIIDLQELPLGPSRESSRPSQPLGRNALIQDQFRFPPALGPRIEISQMSGGAPILKGTWLVPSPAVTTNSFDPLR